MMEEPGGAVCLPLDEEDTSTLDKEAAAAAAAAAVAIPEIAVLAASVNPQQIGGETPADILEATSPRATGRVAAQTLPNTGPSDDDDVREGGEVVVEEGGETSGTDATHKAEGCKTKLPLKLQLPTQHDEPQDAGATTPASMMPLSPGALTVPSPSSNGSGGGSSRDRSPPVSPRMPVEFKDRFLERRDKIALEILTSERKYVAVLQFVMDEYLLPLKRLARKKSETVVPMSKIPSMFSKIEELHKINFHLLARLEEAIGRNWSPTQCIAPIFLEMAPQLNMYMEYVAHHKMSILTVSKMGKKTQFINFCEAIKAKKEGNMEARRQDLLGLLIQPVQRIPRYQMLLEDLRKRSPEDHPDYQNLIHAVAEITRIANEVNAQMDKEENFLKMYKIQASFIGNVKCIVKEGRMFVREGALIKMCRKVPKKRWFFLFNDALIYGSLVGADKAEKASVYTRETGGKTNNKYTFHRMIEFGSGRQGEKNRDTFKVRDIPDSGDEKYAFQIISSEKSFTVYGRSQEEKEAWMVDLHQQLATLSPEGAVNGEDEGAPVWIPDSKATDCQMCGIGFTVIRRRHHCRNCGKVVCGSCSSQKARLSKLKTEKAVRVCTSCYSLLQAKEEGDEEEGDESSEGNKRHSGRYEGDGEIEKEDDDKKKKKTRKRDKFNGLLSVRRSERFKSPRSSDKEKEKEGLDFEPVQMPSPPPSAESKPVEQSSVSATSSTHDDDKSNTETEGELESHKDNHEAKEHQQLTDQQHAVKEEDEHLLRQDERKDEEKAKEVVEDRNQPENEDKAKEEEPTSPRKTEAPTSQRCTPVLARQTSRDWQQGMLLRPSASNFATAGGNSASFPSSARLASPAMNRVGGRGYRMSIGLERAKLQAALEEEARKTPEL